MRALSACVFSSPMSVFVVANSRAERSVHEAAIFLATRRRYGMRRQRTHYAYGIKTFRTRTYKPQRRTITTYPLRASGAETVV